MSDTNLTSEQKLRPLTELEKQFVAEAEAGYFTVLRHEVDGHPYAMGATKAGNLFDVPVIEIDDPHNGGSIYELDL